MKLIKPSVEYIPQEESKIPYKHIERCARTCYKSENKITVDSAKKFVDGLIMAGHTAMLEHGTVYLEKTFKRFEDNNYRNNPYSTSIGTPEKTEDGIIWKWYITTNFRAIIENNWLDDLKYLCQPTEYHKKRYTLKFVTDIGVCRELLRHRKFSFANESTRYCNYSKDKFGNEVTFIIPCWYTYGNGSNDRECSMDSEFENCCRDSEQSYLRMIQWGAKPEEARQGLPLATKTELIMTGFKEDWDHFFNLRYYGTTGKPHPDMQYIAKLAFDELESKSDYRYPRDEFYEGVIGTSFNKD
jgi:thymidylate synthase (FAD)